MLCLYLNHVNLRIIKSNALSDILYPCTTMEILSAVVYLPPFFLLDNTSSFRILVCTGEKYI